MNTDKSKYNFCLHLCASDLYLWLKIFAFACVSTVPRARASEWKFAFGPGAVSAHNIYDKAIGCGFEPGANIIAIRRGGGGLVTSDRPFYFSVALPEGNYHVTLTLGDPAGTSDTTVKAELRRLMLENVRTESGQLVTRTITVNIRRPEISGDGLVHLKSPRETTTEAWAWDEKLTLEFNGSRPCLDAMEISPADVPTVYLLGDSTVCDQPEEPWNSWGQMLTRFFGPGVAVSNQAESGETADGSRRAGRLKKVLSTMKPGDYLFVQFGHNDMKERGPGIGAFTSYKTNLKEFVDGARARGGIPVLITSVNRKTMDRSGHITNSLGDYPAAVRELAKEQNVPLIDLNAMTKTLYEAIGAKNLAKAFVDGTHQDAYGSYEIAKCVIVGIQRDKLGLAKYVVPDWSGFDPAHPDAIRSVRIPASPKWSKTRPNGS
jgi:lysophospholipase L1-like esterase